MKLSTISHAVLGIVAESDCSTYEIVKAMTARFGPVLRTTPRRLYDEPKRLEALGLLAGTEDWVGDRPRIIWSITVEGRIELARWIGKPDARPPGIEFPDFARVLLAQLGSRDQLLATLEAIARSARDFGSEVAARTPSHSAPHLDDLVSTYLVGLANYTSEWADEAIQSVAEWRSPTSPGSSAKAELRERVRRQMVELNPSDEGHHRHAR